MRNHLYVNNPSLLENRPRGLVIDDVATTCATFFYARKYLMEAGASETLSLAMAMTVDSKQAPVSAPAVRKKTVIGLGN